MLCIGWGSPDGASHNVIKGPTISSPKIIPRAEHVVSRANISDNALKVLYRLNSAGYEAYLVGGGVRDMLLGREPKDFDIATNASPEQVRDVFRNCRLIGRRFRLAHILFGRETIEVATFRRAQVEEEEGPGMEIEEGGRILRDNVYGTLEDDAWRRDFTINALYYNVQDFSVIDYVNGMADITAGVLRIIGDPAQRYREDPVRMLRAVRFAAKIGFQIDAASEAFIYDNGHLLDDIPAARLFDEVLKLFMSGQAVQTYELLRHYYLFEFLFPLTDDSLGEEEDGMPHQLVLRALTNTDARIAVGKPVTPAFLYAALLWEPVRIAMRPLLEQGVDELPALHQAANSVIEEQLRYTSLPRRFSTPMVEIWSMQLRLGSRSGRRAFRLLEHPRFRAAYDFLLLRGESGEVEQALCDWWTEFQVADEPAREEMVKQLGPAAAGSGAKRRKRPPRRKKSAE